MDGQFFPGQLFQFEGDGFLEAGAGLTQKGYGHVYGASDTADLALSYANVDGGSAPTAGDLVVWLVFDGDGSASAIVNLTGSGWAQSSSRSSSLDASLLAKVVVAGDISSPPTVVDNPTFGSIGFWVAYSVTGTISSVAVSAFSVQSSGASAPTDQTRDSSALTAPDVAVTIGGGGGDDGSPSMSMSGATADIDFTSAANVWIASSGETQFLVNATVGGANITFSKGDDGSSNHMASGYVTVDF